MFELKVYAVKILGQCTADPPTQPGDCFTVHNGDVRIPAGGSICMWALHSILPLLPAKERDIASEEDWMLRVHHVQCPDPAGRVVWKIDRVGRADEAIQEPDDRVEPAPRGVGTPGLHDLRIVVQEVRGKCTSGMRPGDYFLLRGGQLYIPPQRHFCLYALQAALPLLPAKQRPLAEGDWLRDSTEVICPDPAGNVVMRIERMA